MKESIVLELVQEDFTTLPQFLHDGNAEMNWTLFVSSCFLWWNQEQANELDLFLIRLRLESGMTHFLPSAFAQTIKRAKYDCFHYHGLYFSFALSVSSSIRLYRYFVNLSSVGYLDTLLVSHETGKIESYFNEFLWDIMQLPFRFCLCRPY